MAAASAIGLGEWLSSSRRSRWWPLRPPSFVLGVLLADGIDYALYALAALSYDWAYRGQEYCDGGFVALRFAICWVTMLSLAWLHDPFNGGWPMVFFVFFTVWSTDIGAYALEKLEGPVLWPSISRIRHGPAFSEDWDSPPSSHCAYLRHSTPPRRLRLSRSRSGCHCWGRGPICSSRQ